MSEKNTNVERAKEVAAKNSPSMVYINRFGAIDPPNQVTDAAVDALDSAGLLVTPLHQRALKACEDFAEKYLPMSDRSFVRDKDVWMRVHDAGRESLAAKKPKERYVAVCIEPGKWSVSDDKDDRRMYVVSQKSPPSLTESEARAVAAALNAEEASRG